MSEQLTPEWHDLTKYPAPDWAKYRAQDSSGYVCDFQYLPNVASSNWQSDEGELSGLDADFERNPRWKDSLVSIDELRDKQKPKQDQSTDANGFQYPIYKKSKATGVAVKFTEMSIGEVINSGKTDYDVGEVSDNWFPHTNSVWQDWTPPEAETVVVPESENPYDPTYKTLMTELMSELIDDVVANNVESFNRLDDVEVKREIPQPQYDPKDVAFQQEKTIWIAEQFLHKSLHTMEERAKEYDQDGGERSMGKTVQAFNIITGHNLKESDGWLLMELLKNVRQWSTPNYHHDSALDGVAYSALKAEALAGGK